MPMLSYQTRRQSMWGSLVLVLCLIACATPVTASAMNQQGDVHGGTGPPRTTDLFKEIQARDIEMLADWSCTLLS